MTFEITDDLLNSLSGEWLDSLAERYPSRPRRPIRPSLAFRWRMRRFCRRVDREYQHGLEERLQKEREWLIASQEPRAAQERKAVHLTPRLVLAIVLLLATVTVAMACAIQYYFRIVREDHRKYSSFHYEQTEGVYAPDEFICYTAAYIPEGFQQTLDRTTEVSHQEKYVSTDGQNLVITFHQTRIDRASFDLDTEDIEPVEILLNGNCPAWYLGNEGHKVIYWNDGEYSLRVSGYLDKEELVKIAESVVEK